MPRTEVSLARSTSYTRTTKVTQLTADARGKDPPVVDLGRVELDGIILDDLAQDPVPEHGCGWGASRLDLQKFPAAPQWQNTMRQAPSSDPGRRAILAESM